MYRNLLMNQQDQSSFTKFWREFIGGFFKPLKNITKFYHFSMCVNEQHAKFQFPLRSIQPSKEESNNFTRVGHRPTNVSV